MSKASTADRIKESASHLFFNKGFEETTFLDIAKRAKLTQPAIYGHFSNKMDLLKHVILTAAMVGRDFIDAQINPKDKAMQRLKSYLEANLNFFDQHKEHAHSMMSLYYFGMTSPEMAALFHSVQDKSLERLETILIQAKHEGLPMAVSETQAASMIHALLIGACYKTIYARAPQFIQDLKVELWATVHKMLDP